MATTLAPAEETILARLLPELVGLSPAARLEAVSRLIHSMQTEVSSAPRKTLLNFAGAWADSGESAEELCESIRAARYFHRPDVDLDC